MARPKSSDAPEGQEYLTDRRGRRYPTHTRGLKGACVCNGCRQRRYWTKARRKARGADIAAQYADGRRVWTNATNLNRAAHWHPNEDALLRDLAGKYDSLTIGRMLGERLHKPRSESSVNHRLKRLGIFRLDVRPLSSSEVGRIFGITRETVRVRFVNGGLLIGQLRRGGPHGMRMFTRQEVEKLIREHPEAYDVEAIRDPALKALAQAVTRGRRLLPTREVSRATGIDGRTLAGWYARGLIPSARKVVGVLPGATGAWLIEASDVETVKAIRAARPDVQRERANARRDPLTGTFLRADETPSSALRCTLRVIDRADVERRLVAV